MRQCGAEAADEDQEEGGVNELITHSPVPPVLVTYGLKKVETPSGWIVIER